MSYKQAWDLVNHMNDGFKQPLVISKRGGKGGGVALLTPFGLEVIGEFKDLQQKFSQFLDSNSKK
ncbi:winged helix-turn-helix domain-containing protein [Mucilaginibacter sp. P25]